MHADVNWTLDGLADTYDAGGSAITNQFFGLIEEADCPGGSSSPILGTSSRTLSPCQ
jgi:hypothetical protein